MHGKLYEWWPDLVVVISGFYVHPWTWDILKFRPHKTAVIFTESPYEDDRQLTLVEKAAPDVVVLNDPINIGKFRAAHDKVIYLPHCYDPDIHYPSTQPPDTDFVFVGTGYQDRIELLDAVNWDGLTVKLAGNWNTEHTQLSPFLVNPPAECIDNRDAADLYRRAKVSMNRYRREANRPELRDGYAVGPREVELAACQTFFLRDDREESNVLFPMLPTFTTADELEEMIRWWAAHDRARNKAAVRARQQIINRTFDQNTRRLLQLVDD